MLKQNRCVLFGVETREMRAVETKQMSPIGTRQSDASEVKICLVSTTSIYPALASDI